MANSYDCGALCLRGVREKTQSDCCRMTGALDESAQASAWNFIAVRRHNKRSTTLRIGGIPTITVPVQQLPTLSGQYNARMLQLGGGKRGGPQKRTLSAVV